MLEKMKIALRIKSDNLNEEIASVINSARQELIRAGVDSEKAQDETDDLIISAIRAYVLSWYCVDDKQQERYQRSFETQLDNLRKSTGYMAVGGEADDSE